LTRSIIPFFIFLHFLLRSSFSLTIKQQQQKCNKNDPERDIRETPILSYSSSFSPMHKTNSGEQEEEEEKVQEIVENCQSGRDVFQSFCQVFSRCR
jgi:hypothetical protein